jgi:hypothetical protein
MEKYTPLILDCRQQGKWLGLTESLYEGTFYAFYGSIYKAKDGISYERFPLLCCCVFFLSFFLNEPTFKRALSSLNERGFSHDVLGPVGSLMGVGTVHLIPDSFGATC